MVLASENLATENPSSFDELLARAKSHWRSGAQEGEITGSNNIALRYARLLVDNPRGLIVIAPGRAESYLKYQDTAYQLNQAGYSVFLYDHRGQGLSGRMLSDTRKGHVESFDHYVNDLKILYDEQIKPHPAIPIVLLAHSMGGTIGALYAEQYPRDFQAMILTSPMLGLPAGSAGRWLAKTIDSVEKTLSGWFGYEPAYIPRLGRYSDIPFEKNGVTHSRERFQHIGRLVREFPQIALGDPTTHWVNAAYRAFDILFANISKIEIPILLLQGGDDEIIDNAAQNKFCQLLGDHCHSGQPLRIADALHELLNEADEFRDIALQQIIAFVGDVTD